MEHERKPISIPKILAVGSKFQAHIQDGWSLEMGLWDVEVRALDLTIGSICLRLSQSWKGADTRGGQYWSEDRILKLSELIFPVGLNGGE